MQSLDRGVHKADPTRTNGRPVASTSLTDHHLRVVDADDQRPRPALSSLLAARRPAPSSTSTGAGDVSPGDGGWWPPAVKEFVVVVVTIPTVLLLFAALLPQFIDPAAPDTATQLAVLGTAYAPTAGWISEVGSASSASLT